MNTCLAEPMLQSNPPKAAESVVPIAEPTLTMSSSRCSGLITESRGQLQIYLHGFAPVCVVVSQNVTLAWPGLNSKDGATPKVARKVRDRCAESANPAR
jgi:hypothetical protein